MATNLGEVKKTRVVVNEQYYYEQMLATMKELMVCQANIEERLAIVLENVIVPTKSQTTQPVTETVAPVPAAVLVQEPVKAEPVKAEPVKVKSIKAESVKTEPAKKEPDHEMTYGEFIGKIHDLMRQILNTRFSPFKNKKEIYAHVYSYMRRNYGICWEQEVKDAKRTFYLTYYPKKIEACYYNEANRKLFLAVLEDLLYEATEKEKEIPQLEETPEVTVAELISLEEKRQVRDYLYDTEVKGKTPVEIVRPLAEKYGDRSQSFNQTFKKVYSQMDSRMNGINWEYVTDQYRKAHNIHKNRIPKTVIIWDDDTMKREFVQSVGDLMNKTMGVS